MFDLNIRATFRYSSICNYPNGQLLAVAVRYSSKGRKKIYCIKLHLQDRWLRTVGTATLACLGTDARAALATLTSVEVMMEI